MTACESVRYAPATECADDPDRWAVTYRSSDGILRESHHACFHHAMAEVERHDASGGIATIEVVDVRMNGEPT